ncbi:MAG: amino acid transporter [Saprospiraceae bacterium]|nr:MAG: amino acid transporter [Saprospiraceae bacterium]
MEENLRQRLTLFGLTSIAVGSCIGSGIFVTPGQIASALGNEWLVLLVWLLGGGIALCGALTFAELGGLFPRSGGVYVYLREAFGELTAFLYGWVILLVINTGALAGLCVAFAEYMSVFFPTMSHGDKTAFAAATMAFLTVVNMRGVHISQGLANVFMVLKLAAIAGIIAVGVCFYDPAHTPNTWRLATDMPDNLTSALLAGLIGVFFSVGGWHHATYVAGEAKNAQRVVPRAMLLGVLIVTAMYLLVNVAYMSLLPLQDIAATNRVAAEALARVWPGADRVVTIAIALSIFGTISIYTMSAPRIYYAMARDGIFFEKLATVHPRWGTPVMSMAIQAVWAMVVLFFFSGLFEHIITFVTFMDIAFMGLAGVSVFVFRRKLPHKYRPVRAWGYPLIPFVFVALSFLFAINTLLEKPGQALPGVFLLAIGIMVFLFLKKIRAKS